MQNKLKPQKYLKCVVICHGKSEYIIVKHLNLKMRLSSLDIMANKKGKSSVQIKGLLGFIDRNLSSSENGFITKNKDRLQNKKLSDDFKVFTIMDTDDEELTSNDIKKYKNGEMFKGHWVHKYITPIYNTKNLEEVLLKIGVINKNTEKKDYLKIFPIDRSSDEDGIQQVQEMVRQLSKVNNTNMDKMLEYFIFIAQNNR